MQPARRIEYKPDPDKFDLVTHRWDGQGKLVAKNTYRKFINLDGEFYERPVGSGNLWLENNKPAGRLEYKVNEKGHIYDKEFKLGAEHKEFVPAPTGAEMVAAELVLERAKSARLEEELRSISKERDVKNMAPQATAVAQPPKLTKRE